MNFILNIGLKSETLGDIPAQQALDAVNAADVFVYGSQVFESDTEPTLVLTARNGQPYIPMGPRFEQIAVALGQDCIAVVNTDMASGRLYGPRAAAWGDFNPEFFLMPDGTRLAAPTQLAA